MMKKWILLSALLHCCFAGTVVIVNRTSPGLPKYAHIVPVELIVFEPEKQAQASGDEMGPESEPSAEPEASEVQVQAVKKELAVSPKTEPAHKTEPSRAEAEDAPRPRLTVQGEPFPYNYYLEMLRKRIQENWHPPFQGTGQDSRKNAVVAFRILRNGAIEKVSLEKGTGQFMFDQAARRAVDAIGRMPPLPPEFAGNYITIHLEFETRLP